MLNRTAFVALIPAMLLSAPLAAAAPPATAPSTAASPDRLSAQHHVALRCGALFAITAGEQARGLPQARRWPVMAQRGREYFVRTAARIMDDTGATREEIRVAASREAQAVQRQVSAAADPAQAFATQMNACLPLLDTVVPAPPRKR